MSKLMVLVGSVRPNRIGLPIGRWVADRIAATSDFEIDFADLGEIALPLMDEPNHPRARQYTKPYTVAWSERVDAADAFVFISPEYNHSVSPALKNALDYLSLEWWRKPVSFVSYGGISSGTRGVSAIEPAIVGLGLVKTGANLELPFASSLIEDGVFAGTAKHEGIVDGMVAELTALDAALRPLR